MIALFVAAVTRSYEGNPQFFFSRFIQILWQTNKEEANSFVISYN